MLGIAGVAGIAGIAGVANTAGAAEPADWHAKVDPAVLARWQERASPPAGGVAPHVEFLVFLAEQADLAPAAAIASRAERGAFVMSRLEQVANRSQASLVRELEARGAEYRSFWVANMIWVRADPDMVETMALRPEVARVAANPYVRMASPVISPESAEAGDGAAAGIEPNLTLVGAPEVWHLGYTGQGAVLASADTGVQWDHPALQSPYRGWNGATADHSYNWHDAIHAGGGSCGANTVAPCDDVNHGTHTVGTMLGDDGGSNRIGMAPGARWIACRNMDQGVGSPATYSECFQWFIAPTDIGDENPDPSKAPHVINNSWSCPVSEGCNDPLILQTVVENTRAAGIAVVVSAGNTGPSCGTVNRPTAIYDASYSVAASELDDVIASFSARGPVTVDGSNRLKPDIAAPGVGIRSSRPGNSYGNGSGTSMAAPHVAGLMALLISAKPELEGRPGALETLINGYPVPLTTSQGCGGDTPNDIPNHVYGHGRIDALASLQAALAWELPGLSFGSSALMALWLCWRGARATRRRRSAPSAASSGWLSGVLRPDR